MNRSLRNTILLFSLMIPFLCNGQFLQEGFTIETVTEEPPTMVGCTFSDDGVMYIWTKDGQVWSYRDGSLLNEPVLDISEEVASYGDHGMLGFALDPNFLENGFIYTSYVVDRHHLLYFGTPEYDPNASIDNRATIGRITRFQLDKSKDFLELVPGSRQVLLGKGVEDNLAILHNSHSIGALAFGDDGTLLAGFGDGTTWEGVYVGDGPPYFNADVETAIQDGILEPDEDLGSFRSQLMSFHNGKLLRIDPETGAGIESNPFYDPQDPHSAQSKIWALGLRNPYRFTIRKGSGNDDPDAALPGTVYLGDVSHFNREELNILPFGGLNLGWPLYEGEATGGDYYLNSPENPLAPNPEYDGADCQNEYYKFSDLVLNGNPDQFNFVNPCSKDDLQTEHPTFYHKWPDLTWRHHWTGNYAYAARYGVDGTPEQIPLDHPDSKIEGEMFYGVASVAGTFYTSDKFPEEYRDKYFHLDYKGWIRMFDMDLNDEIQSIDLFYENDKFLVHLEEGPDGCLYLVELPGGIQRICFGGNVRPKAAFSVDEQYGPSPMTVAFKNESTDSNDDPLTYLWEFGDGGTSIQRDPSHQFIASSDDPESFEVKLTVEDGNGGSASVTKIISLNNTPPKVDITSFEDGQFYGDEDAFTVELSGEVSDFESPREDLELRWESHLHHNTHSHFELAIEDVGGEMRLGSVGCDQTVPVIYYYRLQLTATDPQGLSTTDTVYIYPDCDYRTRFLEASYFESNGLSWTVETTDSIRSFSLQMKAPGGYFREFDRMEDVDLFGGTESFTFESGLVSTENLYRIKYETYGGTFGYSEDIDPDAQDELKLLGNPVRRDLMFEVPFANEIVHVSIYNTLGQEVFYGELASSSQEIYSIDMRSLNSGAYTLIVRSGQSQYKTSFVKVN